MPHEALPASAASMTLPALGSDLRAWTRAVRKAVDVERAAGRPWEGVFEAVRSQVSAVWSSLDDRARRQFLIHLRPWWEVHRHRAPAYVLDYLHSLEREGRLDVVAGTITGAAREDQSLRVDVRQRGSDQAQQESWDWLVLATGPDLDLATSSPLYASLLGAGYVAQDTHRVGLLADARGRARGRDGRLTPGLYILGGARRAQEWESTAVPELRGQAAAMAELLSEEPASLGTPH
jgi:uncharacterized NAD(P)/FAD-binding protein YdhS